MVCNQQRLHQNQAGAVHNIMTLGNIPTIYTVFKSIEIEAMLSLLGLIGKPMELANLSEP